MKTRYMFFSHPMCNYAEKQVSDGFFWVNEEVYFSTQPGVWHKELATGGSGGGLGFVSSEISAYEFGRLVGKGIL